MPKAVDKDVQGSKLGINIEETMFGAFVGDTKETFVADHVSISKMAQMMFCPCCFLYAPMVSKSRTIEYIRECGLTRCPYAVNHNDKFAGKVHDIGCCDNGCWFCCCPWLTCGGKIKILSFDDKNRNERFLFAKSLFPCWPLVQSFATLCAPLGFCCVGLSGCYNYCNGTEVRTITQPVYKGPWSRANGGDPEPIGEFVITQRFQPVALCFALPSPLTYYYKPKNAEGENLSEDDLASLSLALAMYRGLPMPCKLCSTVDFQMPMGIPCTDIGLDTQTDWKSVQEIMSASD